MLRSRSMAISAFGALDFSRLVSFLLENEIKWNSTIGNGQACLEKIIYTCYFIKGWTPSIHYFIFPLPPNPYLSLWSLWIFLFFFSFVSSNLVFQQWSVVERAQALKADKPGIESGICLPLVMWPGVWHSCWTWAYSL